MGEKGNGREKVSRVFLSHSPILLFSLSTSTLYACPMCADLIERGKGAFELMRFGNGISWSIYFMLSVPFLLVAIFAIMIFRTRTNQKGIRHGSE
jgi:hypothetical protein